MEGLDSNFEPEVKSELLIQNKRLAEQINILRGKNESQLLSFRKITGKTMSENQDLIRYFGTNFREINAMRLHSKSNTVKKLNRQHGNEAKDQSLFPRLDLAT
jgi:hypothetical protein